MIPTRRLFISTLMGMLERNNVTRFQAAAWNRYAIRILSVASGNR